MSITDYIAIMPPAARGSFKQLKPSADKPQPKRLLFTRRRGDAETRRRGDAEMFFVINFFTLRLCVSACKKIFCRKMAGFHWLITRA
jgi:hypothetical protein